MALPRNPAAAAGVRASLTAQGHACTYIRPVTGAEISTVCALERAVEFTGYESEIAERGDTVSLLVEDVGTPEEGDRVRIGDQEWDLFGPRSDDGYVVTVEAREVVIP